MIDHLNFGCHFLNSRYQPWHDLCVNFIRDAGCFLDDPLHVDDVLHIPYASGFNVEEGICLYCVRTYVNYRSPYWHCCQMPTVSSISRVSCNIVLTTLLTLVRSQSALSSAALMGVRLLVMYL